MPPEKLVKLNANQLILEIIKTPEKIIDSSENNSKVRMTTLNANKE